MPRAPAEILELLARHHGLSAAPRPALRQTAARVDLGDADHLVGLDDPDVVARIEARLADDPEDPVPALCAELRAFTGRTGPCALVVDLPTARARAADDARTATGRPLVVAIGGRTAGLGEPTLAFGFGEFEAAARAIDARAAEIACVMLEPRADADLMRDLVARAAAVGARIVLDESRTAGRLSASTVAAEAGIAADELLLGPAFAAGLPFAARFGVAAAADRPDAVTLEVALAVTARLRAAPIADLLAARGEAVRARFAARARTEDITAEMCGPAALPRVRFAGQENAESPLIAHHFQLELRGLGVEADADVAVPIELDRAAIDAVGDAFEAAIARIRTLLIEHNSYLSGGVPYVFPDGDPRLRARGIAKYRYPKLGGVTVAPVEGNRMRIAFDAGPLGPITSSGFYLPTRVRGDFEICIHYAVLGWKPGPDSACLGLFVQNEPSTARYYAQIMSTSDRAGEISAAAGLAGQLSGRTVVPGQRGWLRLVRTGARVAAFHRDEQEIEWRELGALEPCSRDDVIVGAKIWSKVECGGLVVDLDRLTIDAEIPSEQFPELEPRPDPRDGDARAARSR